MSRRSQRVQKKKLDRHVEDDSTLIEVKKTKKEQNRNVYNFPIEILVKILSYIPKECINKFALVSKSFYEAVNIVDEGRLWVYRCDFDKYSHDNDNLADYEKFIDSDNEECPAIFITSINEGVMDFFKLHGKRVKQLKFFSYGGPKIDLSSYKEILKLVPNCEALCIIRLTCEEEFEIDFSKIPMLKLKTLCFTPDNRYNQRIYKCIEFSNLEEMFMTTSDGSKVKEKLSKKCSHNKNLKVKCIDKYDRGICYYYQGSNCISLQNKINEQITSDQITTFDRFYTIMSSKRHIRKIKFDLNYTSSYKHKLVLKILNKIGNNLIQVTLSGNITGNFLSDLLKCIKNCKILILDSLKLNLCSQNNAETVEFKNLEILELKTRYTRFCLKLIKLSENCLKRFTCENDSEENFNEILRNQKNLEIVLIDTPEEVEKDFLADCKLKHLSLSCFGDDKNSYIDIIKRQPQLKELKLKWIWDEMFKSIATKLLNLQKLDIKNGKLSPDNFKLITNLGKLKELHLNEIDGDWKDQIENCSNQSLEILTLIEIQNSSICEKLSTAFPNLKRLNLTNFKFTVLSFKSFFQSMYIFRNLKSLIIKKENLYGLLQIPVSKFENFEFQNEQLKELYMNIILDSDEIFMKKFVNAFKNLEKLSIRISVNDTTLDQLKILLSPSNKLEYADINIKSKKDENFSTDDLLFILKKKNLKHLHIYGLNVTDLSQFKKVFRKHFKKVSIDPNSILLVKDMESVFN
ncbi:hypothetical protein PVAND_009064 [Polypedilum vanderplanki]|uniref:F-box domain-containing protein n=1 Tax=Polypedilum vanderplanki TaxID=319348 RepID=A0A9J6CBJ3_POLVA|nr:hypothetical protein PVAND_009064 [Polypedilum vanderplanki]